MSTMHAYYTLHSGTGVVVYVRGLPWTAPYLICVVSLWPASAPSIHIISHRTLPHTQVL
jgi:hypothetical protein